MKNNMHLGGTRPTRIRAVGKGAFVAEPDFYPEAAKTDDNPFPQELQEEQPVNYESMTVGELRALLRARGLELTGKKAELITRLTEADTPSEEAVDAEVVAPSQEAATSDEGVSDIDANNNSRPDEPIGQ